ncbi:fimbrial protein [Dyella choica]|nr:fimbrial protein [Dyella choica]
MSTAFMSRRHRCIVLRMLCRLGWPLGLAWAGIACAQNQATLDVTGNIKGAPCRIKNSAIPVDLGEVKSSDFKGQGQRLAPVSYRIELLGCPRYATITYQIDPQTTIVDASQSVIAMQGGQGSAAKVGLQLLTDQEKALPLRQAIPVPGYDPSHGGDLSIPLKVAFYQTEAGHVGGGTAKASATFTLSYP